MGYERPRRRRRLDQFLGQAMLVAVAATVISVCAAVTIVVWRWAL